MYVPLKICTGAQGLSAFNVTLINNSQVPSGLHGIYGSSTFLDKVFIGGGGLGAWEGLMQNRERFSIYYYYLWVDERVEEREINIRSHPALRGQLEQMHNYSEKCNLISLSKAWAVLPRFFKFSEKQLRFIYCLF